MNFLRVGKTLRISDSSSEEKIPVTNYDLLFKEFITEVSFIAQPKVQITRVDTFPLLYGLMEGLYCLERKAGLEMEIGEGYYLTIKLLVSEPSTITVGYRSSVLSSSEITPAEVIFLLSSWILEVHHSISDLGEDMLHLLRRFPPALM